MTLNEKTISMICRCDFKVLTRRDFVTREIGTSGRTSLRRMILSVDCATSRYFDIRRLKARSSTMFTSKLFLGIEPNRGHGKIYAKLRRRLVSTRRHTHDKALRSVLCIPGFYLRPTRASHGNMYEREKLFFFHQFAQIVPTNTSINRK